MKHILEMLSENGQLSTMRVMAVTSLLVASGIAIYGVIQNKDLSGVAQIVAIFVAAAFTGKTIQKFTEPKE